MSAGDEAAQRARNLRTVLTACERIMADRDAAPERREAAERWYDRLAAPESDGYGHGERGGRPHHSGGGLSDHQEFAYQGWGSE